MNIKVLLSCGYCLVTAPPHPDFLSNARKIGGNYSELLDQWAFDDKHINAVKTLLTKVFGTDGVTPLTPDDLVTVTVKLHEHTAVLWEPDGVWIVGMRVLDTNGTSNNIDPRITFLEGEPTESGLVGPITMLIQDVPRLALLHPPGAYNFALTPSSEVPEKHAATEPETLLEERQRLRQRIAQIEVLMATGHK